MITRQIKLNATEDVQEFVNEAAKCSFDIDISYNRIIIDAKSLLQRDCVRRRYGNGGCDEGRPQKRHPDGYSTKSFRQTW